MDATDLGPPRFDTEHGVSSNAHVSAERVECVRAACGVLDAVRSASWADERCVREVQAALEGALLRAGAVVPRGER